MNYHNIARDILEHVGGKENIKNITHCFTRLRFVLKESSKANKEIIEHLEGVISVVIAGGQFQVVCGAKVTKIYDALIQIVGESFAGGEVEDEKEKQSIGNIILQKVTEIFTPLVPAIAAAGLIKGVLTAAKLLMANYGYDLATTDTYNILYNASQVIFYFMPIFLAYTTAKALKCNQVIAMAIGGTLVYPAIDAMIQNTEVASTIFGLPIMKGAWQIGDAVKVFSYVESVIPIILAVIVMAGLERLLKKYIPEILQIILVPGLELIIMLPLIFVVLGPIGIYVGNGVQWVYDSIMSISAILGGALIGGLWGVCVIFGAHRALLPIGLNDVAVNGHQNLLAFAGSANFAQGGAAFGVMLKTKSKDLKQVAASSTIAAALVGITEPAIYGCNLRLKKPMIYAVICGAIGGAIMGLGNVYGDAFANNGVLTIFTYAAYGMSKFMFYLAGIAIAFFGAAAMSYFLGFDDIDENTHTERIKKEVLLPQHVDLEIGSPIEGEAVDLTTVNDEVFASCALGKGIAIIPSRGEVLAPANCVVSLIYPTLHALGFTLEDGTEILIHIGMDTVNLKGKHFKKLVEEGSKVKKGTPIISFDLEALEKEGFDMSVPVVITNTNQFKDIIGIPNAHVDLDTTVIAAVKEKV